LVDKPTRYHAIYRVRIDKNLINKFRPMPRH